MDRRKIGISDILAMYILIWSVSPIMASGMIYRVVLVLSVGIWILLHINFLYRRSNMTIAILIFLVSTFILRSMSGGISSGISWTINTAVYCIIAILGRYYLEYRFNNMQLILIVMLICTSIISIISIQTVIVDPTALRLATHEWDQGAKSYGAYDYVYMCVQGIPIFFIILKTKVLRDKEYIWTILTAISFVLCVVLVILSGFTLANIITLAGLTICMVFINPSVKKTLVIIFIALLCIFTYKYLLQEIFSFLLSITEDASMYTRKIQELSSQFLHGTGIGESYSDRVSLYMESWNAIAKYPLFGSIFWSGEIVGGGHSTLVDVIAYGGVFYAVFYYWQMIIFPIKLIGKAKAPKKISRLLIMVFLTTSILTGVFDTITYAYAWIWFWLIPYVAKKVALSSWEDKEK